jgi:hypothetical protein
MSREPSVRARQLRAELRRGDPGAGEVLAPEEEAAMRRITIEAAAASGSRVAGWLARPRPASSAGRVARRRRSYAGNSARKVFAAAAAAAICVVAAVSWQERLRPHEVGDGGPPSLRRAAAARGPQPDALGQAAGGVGRAAAGQAPSAGEQAARIAPLDPLDGRAPKRARLEPVPPARAARAPVAAGVAGMPAPHAREGSAVAGVDTRNAAAPADPAETRAAAAEPQAEPQDRSETAAAGPPAPGAPNALAEVGPAVPPRQVQFSLPGGTRVIWQVRGPSSR